MSEISYKKNIILFLITIIPLLVFIPFLAHENGFTKLLPNQLGFQISYIFWMSAVAAVIGGMFIGFLLVPLFLLAHKYTVGIRMTYGIQEKPKPTKLKAGFKALFPSLLALNFALMFAQFEWVQNIVLMDNRKEGGQAMILMLTFVSILPLMMGISMGLFSSVWFLLDAGIVFTNKEKVKNIRDPIEVRSVGSWYLYILKGYSGIGIVVSYILFTNSIFMETSVNEWGNGFFLIPLMPFLMVILCIPAFILLETTAEKRINYTLKFAKKLGITNPLDDPLNIGN